MIRRQLLPAIVMMVVFTVLLGFVYPLAVTAVAQIGFHHQANDSLVTRDHKVVGSSLLAQGFLDKDGNPLVKYFQPRPSAAGKGYDASVSSASNLGPSNPLLIGNVPGVSITDKVNAYATRSDPYCVPVPATDKDGNALTDKKGDPVYERNTDGSYACNPGTVPQRAIAYRQLNSMAVNAPVPVDAVTASASGLDPDISVANAELQAPRVARARRLPVSRVRALISSHTSQPQLGFLGEKTVNVLDLNLALDSLHG